MKLSTNRTGNIAFALVIAISVAMAIVGLQLQKVEPSAEGSRVAEYTSIADLNSAASLVATLQPVAENVDPRHTRRRFSLPPVSRSQMPPTKSDRATNQGRATVTTGSVCGTSEQLELGVAHSTHVWRIQK